ncbi:unnamed protein product [Leptosia nina]|uniref:Uncharacterized protein n=1 Tax=Leptosia nina TaxID=320188 RepID=A0AAV1JX90_9NEOP
MLIEVSKLIAILSTWSSTLATIDGRSYMNSLDMRNLKENMFDPCNPPYWYPRNIPEYCYYRVPNKPVPGKTPIKVPLPVPLPIFPSVPHMPPIPPPPMAPPFFVPPLPYGVPLAPTAPMIPMIPNQFMPPIMGQYPFPELSRPQAAMVPGVPGMVSPDGGINILPFSDVYSDMLENHRNKMIRKKLERLLDEFDEYPNRNTYKRLKKYREAI